MQRYEGNMTQSASSPYPIRPIEENELDGFLNVDEHAFNTSPWSDGGMYGRYGYGRASWHVGFTLRRGEGGLTGTAASAADGLRLRIAEPEAALPELAKVYDAVLATRPGMFGRNDAWWRSAIYDPAEHRQGAGPLRCLLAEDASGTRGYALYAGVDTWAGFLPENVLTVRELMATDLAAR